MTKKRPSKASWKPQGIDDIPDGLSFTNSQFKKICSSLPKEAFDKPRPDSLSEDGLKVLKTIDDTIKLYRLLRHNEIDRPGDADVRAAMGAISKAISNLDKAIRQLDIISQGRLCDALGQPPFDPNEGPLNESPHLKSAALGFHRLRLTTKATADMETAVSAVLGEIKSRPGPPSGEALPFSVGRLLQLYQSLTGRIPNRSIKVGSARHFVDVVLALADPNVTSSQIETAMKAAVAKIQSSTANGPVVDNSTQETV